MDRKRYFEALDRYQGYRDAAFDLTWQRYTSLVPVQCDLRIMPIDEKALYYWNVLDHAGALLKSGGFRWDHAFRRLQGTPRRFDVSIWDGDRLCGMCCGRASKGPSHLNIHLLERFPVVDDHLRGFVAEIAIEAADNFAKIIGREFVRLRDPLPSAAAKVYIPMGFELDRATKEHKYLRRRVR